ncbi:S41 family peptidase [Candidatus Saccharibacteria bacterium]|nr:S41 family peptidase [Candidatus Saccharibacteria bacterium]MCA9313753.1 S41 family peptidase [Candidatus Saccharibacteria bacterium]
MNESEGNLRGQKKQVTYGTVILLVIVAFVFGNRFQTLGDWFFAPYTNKGNQALSQNLDFNSTEKVYEILKQKYDGKLDTQSLQDGLLKGLVDASGDPYTTYMSAKEAALFNDDLNGTFTGIGAELIQQNGSVMVSTPLSGFPAEKAGVRARDIIYKINDEDATKLSIGEAVKKIRGDAGSTVKLTLIRDGAQIEIPIVRAKITVASVESSVLDGNVGYIKISRFGDDTADLANKAAQDFKSKNVTKVIVDLRNNGGGLLDSAVKVAGIWMDNQVVVVEKEGGRTKSTLKTGNNPILINVETVILINEGSASASEILAGALHDHGVAKLIGEKTYGKGSVQEIVDLEDGAQLKVTVAHWFTPKGVNVNKEGIKPDEEVKLTEEDFNNNRDPQKDRALQELK